MVKQLQSSQLDRYDRQKNRVILAQNATQPIG